MKCGGPRSVVCFGILECTATEEKWQIRKLLRLLFSWSGEVNRKTFSTWMLHARQWSFFVARCDLCWHISVPRL
ncbi:hypothetical protein [Agriterribacter humi]|uniref:hypothetical protein n=1 Tax=Agriterribacter humi TaxID=1104781 RepID=UPI001263F3A7|nr:hypothetical protein [Agriterribacter humi]